MNSHKKQWFIILGIFFAFQAFAQENKMIDCNNRELLIMVYKNHLTGRLFVDKHLNNKIQYFNDWKPGIVYFKNHNKVENVHLRYNGYLDELLWIRDTDFQTIIVDRKNIAGFDLFLNDAPTSKATFKLMNIEALNIPLKDHTYLQVLSEGRFNLYAYRRVAIIRNRNEMYLDPVYIIEYKNKLYQVNANRFYFYRRFPEHKKAMRSVITGNGLIIKNESALIQFINLINQESELN